MRGAFKIVVTACIATVALIATTTSASAGPITFSFTGTVNYFFADPDDPFFGTINVGTPISGSYTFESGSPDLIADPETASYQISGAPYGIEATIGGHAFGTNQFLAINVAAEVDQYGVIGCDGGSACPDLTMQLFFQDDSGTVFSSDALPLSPPPIASFATRAFHLTGTFGGNQVQIDGEIDTLDRVRVTPVPEPALLLLVGTGVSIALVRRSRNRRRDRTTAGISPVRSAITSRTSH